MHESSQSLTVVTFRSVPTIAEEPDPCNVCNSLMKPVYRAMFKVKDESGSELVVLASDEEAVSVCIIMY